MPVGAGFKTCFPGAVGVKPKTGREVVTLCARLGLRPPVPVSELEEVCRSLLRKAAVSQRALQVFREFLEVAAKPPVAPVDALA